MDAEELVRWTYQDQRADYIVEHGVGLHRIERAVMLGHGGSMTTDSAAMVGARLEGAAGGSSMAACALHPDAEAVHGLVVGMGAVARSLLIPYGQAGMRPDWGEGKDYRLMPMYRANGDIKVERDGRGHDSYCPLVKGYWRPEILEGMRLRYMMWWDFLFRLSESLTAREVLVTHEVRAPEASRTPWIS